MRNMRCILSIVSVVKLRGRILEGRRSLKLFEMRLIGKVQPFRTGGGGASICWVADRKAGGFPHGLRQSRTDLSDLSYLFLAVANFL
jgi:hypothetical protein